ncbi:hypothetical protein M8J76_013377 [Diaphorina citri]|nr:hypothetical protein M8J75_001703 [Diaphorina citri]KAI5716851.1 hypothetical protein M8J76_013377 [Diaphorina citri]
MPFSFESTKTFESCCCGCSLRTGAIIIAVLSIIQGISSLIEENVPHGVGKDGRTIDEGEFQDPAWLTTLFTIGYLITAICAIILLVGIIKRSKVLMLPWLYWTVISFVCALIYVIFTVVLLFIKVDFLVGLAGLVGGVIGAGVFVAGASRFIFIVVLLFIKVDFLVGLAGLVGGVIGAAIVIYFWLVVHSYYIHIKEEEGGVRAPKSTA